MIQRIRNILPVYEKESMTSSRTVRLTAIVMSFNLILALVSLLQLQLMVRDSNYFGEMSYSSMLHMYMLVAVFEAVIVLFVVPALTAGSISGERERQTLDLLQGLLNIRRWRIAHGLHTYRRIAADGQIFYVYLPG